MAWIVRDGGLDREIIKAIETHDDRAAAILAAIYLEDRITSTIEAHGAAESRLTTLAAKIDAMGSAGLFEKPIIDVIHTIRAIRNAFAHELAPLTFDAPSIAELCAKLYSQRFLRGFRSWMNAFEHPSELRELGIDFLEPLIALRDTPRNTYLNTVKVVLLLLQFSLLTTVMRDDQCLEIVRHKTN
jgi:hypothetical protein